MKQKNCSNDEFFIVLKSPEDTSWQLNIDRLNTPTTITFAVSTVEAPTVIKKIVWDLGNGNQHKSFTNRKQDLNTHTISCKYRKAHNTTISIQASVYTDNGFAVTPPLVASTSNREIKEYYVEPEDFKNQIMLYYKTDNFTGDVADSIYKIANRLAFAPNFINYCVDATTEALTQRGWLTYDQITKKDTILSYNDKTKQLTWSKIKDLYVNEYKGKMHYLTTKGLDALVTPNHKFVSFEDGLKPVEYIKSQEHIRLMGLPVEDGEYKYTNEFVELVGWTVTEGNYLPGKYTHAIQVFQKKGTKADRIRNCLLKLNAHFKEYEWTNPEILGFRYSKTLANDIIKIAPNKILSMEFITSLPQEQRLLLIQTMLDGDGWSTKKGDSVVKRGYTQKDKQHVDSFLALCTLAGVTTSCTLVKNTSNYGKGSTYYTINLYNKPKYTCKGECIDMHGGRSKPGGANSVKEFHPNIPTQDYEGTIWCPQTEYGTFVCRRGKYIYITGNTYREEMVGDAVERMVQALTDQKFDPLKGNPFSYFTKIAFHAFCNRIKKEKKGRDALVNYQNEVYNNIGSNHGIPCSSDGTQMNDSDESQYEDN